MYSKNIMQILWTVVGLLSGFILKPSLGIDVLNNTEYLSQFKYDRQSRNDDPTTSAASSLEERYSAKQLNSNTIRPNQEPFVTTEQQPQQASELYTLQMTHHSQRQMKHNNEQIVYDYKCPKQHYIHPCDCLELDKRMETLEGSGDMPEMATNTTPTVEMIEEEQINPEFIETVAFCKNIRNVQVLSDAIRGFQGHRINYLVLDGCKIPPFPNNLFRGIHIVWMEILNSTMQFHDNYFHSKSCQ